jgi:secondary thiamine-phosphate synthase enzyme
MRQSTAKLTIPTRGRGLYEITSRVRSWLADQGIETGLLTLHIAHTSASLLIQENADPSVRADLDMFFARLVPDGDPLFTHNQEGDDDMPAHIRSAVTPVNLSIPVCDGTLALGTWQGIYVWEHRAIKHDRTVTLHVIGE